jgi:hypothetical protein
MLSNEIAGFGGLELVFLIVISEPTVQSVIVLAL